jgi:hypothetical protein
MLAHAFLAVVTATERPRTPGEGGLIPLTLAEVQRLFNRLTTGPTRSKPNTCAGRTGADTTKPAPAKATTSDNPPDKREDHHLQLEY